MDANGWDDLIKLAEDKRHNPVYSLLKENTLETGIPP